MIWSTARPPAVAAVIVLLSSLWGQPAGKPGAPTSVTQELPRFPPVTPKGAGTITPPEGGYFPPPDPPTPGSVHSARIPADEIDRAFWELYDRDKHVMLTGKVTTVRWTEPNVYIFVAASGTEWAVEANYSQFRQANVHPAVQAGQTIIVKGYMAKENPLPRWPVRSSASVASYLSARRLIRAAELTTENGQKLRLGRPLSEEEEKAELLKCFRLGC